MSANDAIEVLSASNHLPCPSGFTHSPLRDKQLAAIAYVHAHQIVQAIPNLILYLDYAKLPGVVDFAHGDDDIGNVKNNWTAFGALVDMPGASPALETYCLDQKNPIAWRLATLHALKYCDRDTFSTCVSSLEESEKSQFAQDYLRYVSSTQSPAPYYGVLGVVPQN